MKASKVMEILKNENFIDFNEDDATIKMEWVNEDKEEFNISSPIDAIQFDLDEDDKEDEEYEDSEDEDEESKFDKIKDDMKEETKEEDEDGTSEESKDGKTEDGSPDDDLEKSEKEKESSNKGMKLPSMSDSKPSDEDLEECESKEFSDVKESEDKTYDDDEGKEIEEPEEYEEYETDEESLKEFDETEVEDLAEKISKEIRKTIDDYSADTYTSDISEDIIENMWENMNNDDIQRFANEKEIMKKYVSGLVKHLRLAVMSARKNRKLVEQRKGKLNTRKLSKLKTGNTRVFYKTKKGKDFNTCITLLVDQSASMSPNKINLARQISILFGEVLSQLHIDFEILGFSSKGTISNSSVIRKDKLYHMVYKGFNNNFKKTKYSIGRMNATEQNCDGESLFWAATRIAKQKHDKKIIFVLSDGSPCALTNCRNLYNHLDETIKLIRNTGIELYSLGMKTSAAKRFYGENYSITINNLETLGSSFFRKLSQMILTGKVSNY